MKVKVSRTQTVVTLVIVAGFIVIAMAVPAVREAIGTWIGILSTGDTSAAMTAFRDYLLGFGVWAPVVSALLMVFQSVAAPLPAFVITFTNGLLFGWVWGALLSWSSAMAGAALCFYIARFLGRPVVEKLVGGSRALEVSDLFFDRYGDRAVLVARLLPFVSFDIISYGAGLTNIGFWRFFIATGIGQLPATLVYSYLGQNLTGSVKVLFFVFTFTTVVFVVASALRPWYMKRLEQRRSADEAGTPATRSRAWYAPAVPVAIAAALFGFLYMAVDTFGRDVRLIGNALKTDDVFSLRIVLHGFGSWEPLYGFLAVLMRMFTAPWSLAPLAEGLVGRLGPAAGWAVLVAGVLAGVAAWAALGLAVVRGVRSLVARRATS